MPRTTLTVLRPSRSTPLAPAWTETSALSRLCKYGCGNEDD